MNKRQEFCLQVLDRIDKVFVERIGRRRYELMRKDRKSGGFFGRNKKTLAICSSIAAVLVLCISGFLLLQSVFGSVPVYRGMTVSDSFPDFKAQSVLEGGAELPQAIAANGKGLTPQSMPSGATLSYSGMRLLANQVVSNIANQTESTPVPSATEAATNPPPTAESAEKMYYANAGQAVFITVHIDNPRNYEILSFTLNGKKYSSYMFEEGSNMENLVLKVEVGKTEAVIEEYTIDAIKYIDGTEIKDVKMDGDRTVRIGVRGSVSPTVSIENIETDYLSMTCTVTLNDPQSLIALTGGYTLAVLQKGEEIVASDYLTAEAINGLTYEGLMPNTAYELSICTVYDLWDGNGPQTFVLADQSFSTDPLLTLEILETTPIGASFSVNWHEQYTERELRGFQVYQGDTKIIDLGADATEVTGLLHGIEYTLVAIALYNGVELEANRVSFVTVAELFSLHIVKTTPVGADFSIKWYQNQAWREIHGFQVYQVYPHGTKVADLPGDATEVTGLLPGTQYAIVATILQNGAEVMVDRWDFTTTNKLLSLKVDKTTLESAGFSIEWYQGHVWCEIHGFQVYQGGAKVADLPANATEVTGLLHGTKYALAATILYNGVEVEVGRISFTTEQASFTVNHHFENPNDSDYTLQKTQTLYAGAVPVRVSALAWEGYISPEAQIVEVKADGSTVVDYYYQCKTYQVTFVSNGGSPVASGTYKYGQTLPSSTREGNTFGGWGTKAEFIETYTVMPDTSETVTLYAWWQEETVSGYFKYSDNYQFADGLLNGVELKHISIPMYVGGKRVSYVGNFSRFEIESLVLNAETQMCEFWNIKTLKHVTIGDYVYIIGTETFLNCTALTSVTIGKNVTSISQNAFSGCPLTSVTVENPSDWYDNETRTQIENEQQLIEALKNGHSLSKR